MVGAVAATTTSTLESLEHQLVVMHGFMLISTAVKTLKFETTEQERHMYKTADKTTPVRVSHGQIVIPFHRIGDPEYDLVKAYEAFAKVAKVNKS